jgi:hypothetical protein
MNTTVALTENDLTVAAGERVSCSIRIRNSTAVVDHFRLDIVGDAADWARIEPAAVNLLPGAEQTAELVFEPPRSSAVPAATVPFGVRMRAQENPEVSSVAEGTVTVEPFVEVAAELVPRTSRARRRARHQLIVDNNGNADAPVEVFASDPDRLLRLRVQPPAAILRPGKATFITVRVRPRKRFLTGPDRPMPFQVAVVRPDTEPLTNDGVVVQRALLPAWSPRAILVAVAVVAGGLALWFGVLKPTVQSTAKEAAAAQNQQLTKQVSEVKSQASAAAKTAQDAQQAVTSGGAGKPKPGASPTPTKPAGAADGTLANADPATATDFRLAAKAAPAAAGTFTLVTYQPAKGKLLWVTDVVLQNPRGDLGTLQVRRGDDVLLEEGLNNIRDLDYHFVQPLRFAAGQSLSLAVNCTNVGGTVCTPAAYFGGQLVPAPAPASSSAAAR